MIINPHPQGSNGWLAHRLGKATASHFHEIMTFSHRKAAKSNYRYRLTAERLMGEEILTESYVNDAMEYGNAQEPEARVRYELIYDTPVQEVGFCEPFPDAQYGASPDGLIGEDGGIEIKCSPSLATHLQRVGENSIPSAYLSQIYGGLFVTGRQWWDFVAYYPEVAFKHNLWVKRVHADDPDYIDWKTKFKPILEQFLEETGEFIKDMVN